MADKSKQGRAPKGGAAPLYGMGVLGALVYYIDTSTSFFDGVWGIVLSFFWPAVLVYHALDGLGA